MERRDYLSEVKTKQKELAKQIRTLKAQRPLKNRGELSLWQIESALYNAKYEYRHRHIAYCMLRGTQRCAIERPKSGYEPNERYIKSLLEEYEEAVCVGQD